LSPEFATALRTTQGVRLMSEERLARVEIDGSARDMFMAFDTTTIGKLFDLGHVEGDISKLGGAGIAVHAQSGTTRPQLGDTREATFVTGSKTFVVRATYDNSTEWVGDEFVG